MHQPISLYELAIDTLTNPGNWGLLLLTVLMAALFCVFLGELKEAEAALNKKIQRWRKKIP